MRKAIAGILSVVALVVAGVAFAGSASSPPVVRPFVAAGGLAMGMSGVGDGPSTPAGDHLRCWNGRRYAQNMTLLNRSGVSVTLTGAVLDPPSPQIVRRVAVQVRLAPPPPSGDVEVTGLRDWSRSAPTPTTIPPGRNAWVQSNFVMHDCNLLSPRHALISNRAITLAYRANGHAGHQRIALRSGRIILTR
jgi:hypothetical protein